MSRRVVGAGLLAIVTVVALVALVYAVTSLKLSDPGVQGAVVGAMAGVVGGIIGALIGAVGAWIVARGNRDEERAGRFADRVRELAGQMLDNAGAYCRDVNGRAIIWRMGGEPVTHADIGPTFGQSAQELRLIVRLPSTYNAVKRITLAVDDLPAFESMEPSELTTPGSREWWTRWRDAEREYREAALAFEDAIRVELGAAAIAYVREVSE